MTQTISKALVISASPYKVDLRYEPLTSDFVPTLGERYFVDVGHGIRDNYNLEAFTRQDDGSLTLRLTKYAVPKGKKFQPAEPTQHDSFEFVLPNGHAVKTTGLGKYLSEGNYEPVASVIKHAIKEAYAASVDKPAEQAWCDICEKRPVVTDDCLCEVCDSRRVERNLRANFDALSRGPQPIVKDDSGSVSNRPTEK